MEGELKSAQVEVNEYCWLCPYCGDYNFTKTEDAFTDDFEFANQNCDECKKEVELYKD